ncbi:MAG: bifunctional glutamate N-acetyltransferase/amino-acid acetyltransferase ArgJ [Candidatus Ancaeobacter aquaticus]|nr:bifunctional glutamate N-acetyltransferase/amino-acid acetyltransferase ArgJ [Candidatus Ancaeobacter aquaticus]
MKITNGSITTPKGYKAGGISCGTKTKGKKDLSFVVSDIPAVAAGVFTTNEVKAAPVKLTQKHLRNGMLQAIITNSGVANACTGNEGMENALKMAQATKEALDLKKSTLVAVCSTGVIGKQLPIKKIQKGAHELSSKLSRHGGVEAAESIMTTDTHAKHCAVKCKISGKEISIGGIAKGSGMIEPNMATMLSYITTDCAISEKLLRKALQQSVDKSFNCISVDGDMSTNDTVLIMANGSAENKQIAQEDSNYKIFCNALDMVTTYLAKLVVGDGEGATKFVEVNVKGAQSDSDAHDVARAVTRSNLFRVALYGEAPYWGRIMSAIGSSGVLIKEEKLSIQVNGKNIVSNGISDENKVAIMKNQLKKKNIIITIDLNQKKGSACMWMCDLSHGYVAVNV